MKKLFESMKGSKIRQRRVGRVFESIKENRAILTKAIYESEEGEEINEDDVVGAITNIVKSLSDLKIDESEVEDIAETAETIEETDDESEKVDAVKEAEEKVSDLIAEYDVKTMEEAHDLDLDESYEIDLGEDEDEEIILDENEIPDEFVESTELDDIDDVEFDLEYSEPETIEENEELDKLEEDAKEAVDEVEKLTNDLEESEDDDESKQIAEELEKAIEEAETEIEEYEDAIDEDDAPAIEYVNEMKSTVARAKRLVESKEEFEEEYGIDETDELDEETTADVEDIVETLLPEEDETTIDIKEAAEDALIDVKELKEELGKLEESDREPTHQLSKDDLQEMEDKLTDFVENEDSEIDEDEIDDIIQSIGEATDSEVIEEVDAENKIVEEGIKGLCKRLGMKSADQREFKSLFEMAVLNATKLVNSRMQKRQDKKIRQLAEGFTHIALTTSKKMLSENKRQLKNQIVNEESARANRLIAESLNAHGYTVRPVSTSRLLRKEKAINESNKKLIESYKSDLRKQKILNEDFKRKALVESVANKYNMSLSETEKLKQLSKSLKGESLNESSIEKLKRMFFKENVSRARTKAGKTNYFNESFRNKKTTIEESKQEKDPHDLIVNSVLQHLDI